MTNIDARIERAKKEISGNESLLEMLEADAAAEMFNWGQELAASIAEETGETADASAEETMAARLKALRQAWRSIGNWAVGKYSDPADRALLKEKLYEQLRLILGERSKHISADEFGGVIDSVDVQDQLPHQSILKLKQLTENIG